VFAHLAKETERVRALVYLTDLFGSFPDEGPEFPVVWVTWTKNKQAPFGITVYAGD
jgi:hypothetical protein